MTDLFHWLRHRWGPWGEKSKSVCDTVEWRRCLTCGDTETRGVEHHPFGPWGEPKSIVVEKLRDVPGTAAMRWYRYDAPIQIQNRICPTCGVAESREVA